MTDKSRTLSHAQSAHDTVMIVTTEQDGVEQLLVAKLPSAVLAQAMREATAITDVTQAGDLNHVVREVSAFLDNATNVEAAPTARSAMLRQAKNFIEANLGNQDLCPELIATGIFVSKRYLHLLFQEDGNTVTRYVIARRLSASLRRLADPRLSHQSIGEIASRLGFKDPSHFARAFRAEYGMTPSQYRSRSSVPAHHDEDGPAAA